MLKLNEQALEMVSGGIKIIVRHPQEDKSIKIVKIEFEDMDEDVSFKKYFIASIRRGEYKEDAFLNVSQYFCDVNLSDFQVWFAYWLSGRHIIIEKNKF